jgi:hypothetical protein
MGRSQLNGLGINQQTTSLTQTVIQRSD